MIAPHSEANLLYRNAMEPLAACEIERQLLQLPAELAASINKADAIAYALNRLPPMYATTQEGWDWQQQQAKEIFANLIAQAASWGIQASIRKNKVFATQLYRSEAARANLQ